MYVQCDTLARSRKHCGHDDATLYLYIYFWLDVAVNNIKVFSVATEKQQLVSFAP
jgi:hypothetical protein